MILRQKTGRCRLLFNGTETNEKWHERAPADQAYRTDGFSVEEKNEENKNMMGR
jgi:hypothetical protein